MYDELQSSSRNTSLMKKGLNLTKSRSGWTASFQCPITGHHVHSGRWREIPKYKESDGAICYMNANHAEHAAVARFLDDMTFSKTGEVEPRLCEEMPSTIENVDKLLEQRHKATEEKQDSLALTSRLQRESISSLVVRRRLKKDLSLRKLSMDSLPHSLARLPTHGTLYNLGDYELVTIMR